jgi:hypothetical protein
MEWPAVSAIAVVLVAIVPLRLFAGRQVRAGRGRFVWVIFAPTLLVTAAPLWVAAVLFPTQPLLAVFLAIGGLVFLGLLVLLLIRVSGGVSAAAPGEARADAVLKPLTDYVAATMGLLLIGGLVALVALLILAVSQAGR